MYALLVSLLTAISLGTVVSTQSIASRSHDEVARQSSAKTYAVKDWYQGTGFFTCVYVWLVPCHPRSDPL